MNRELIYWVWLQQSLGYASKKIKRIFSLYNSILDFYNDGVNNWKLCDCFTNEEMAKMEYYDLENAQKIIDRCEMLDQSIITYNDTNYPSILKQISNPPCLLYAKGDISKIANRLSIAIIGSRDATKSGLELSFEFGYRLANVGVVIVSGGALGIDSASHKGALNANGTTVCVLGCSIDYNYLPVNATLRDEISKKGVLISEYAPGESATRWHFPLRNRIISGLSNGILVVEAGAKSGTSITVNLALEQGRDIFSIPGNIKSATSIGTNKLIKAGAKIVTDIEDILEEYKDICPNLSKAFEFCSISDNKNVRYSPREINNDKQHTYNENKISSLSKELPKELSNNTHSVYDKLSKLPIHVDDLALELDMPINVVSQAITELELYSLVVSHSGKRYSLS